jgi:predicted MFS family arabinose efflux permease
MAARSRALHDAMHAALAAGAVPVDLVAAVARVRAEGGRAALASCRCSVGLRGPRPVAIGALLLIGASSLSLTNLSLGGNFVDDVLLGILLFGPGLGAGFVAGSIASLSGVPERDAGVASGLNSAAFHVGGAIGIAIMAAVALTQGTGANPGLAAVDGFNKAFIASAFFAVAGLLVALTLLGPLRRRPQVVVSAAPDPRRTDHAA